MPNKIYHCEKCGEDFEGTQSEEEALEELAGRFPGYTQEDCDIVCDDCYKILCGRIGIAV